MLTIFILRFFERIDRELLVGFYFYSYISINEL
nr:MAG TPA: hypothetical protein [Caudoviricetes sp.]